MKNNCTGSKNIPIRIMNAMKGSRAPINWDIRKPLVRALIVATVASSSVAIAGADESDLSEGYKFKNDEAAPITDAPFRVPAAVKTYLAPKDVHPFGTAPNLKWQVVKQDKPRSYLLVFGKNDDLIAGLNAFAEKHQIKTAFFSGVGALNAAALGYYEPTSKEYHTFKTEKQTELASFSGNISVNANGKYLVHAHAVLANNECECRGGHVLFASAWPTVEVNLSETDTAITRSVDKETGLSLCAPKE